MPKYRKKPAVIEATRWYGSEGHEAVQRVDSRSLDVCQYCNLAYKEHGWMKTLRNSRIVCPGDWIITDTAGEHYPCKPDIFATTYELVKERASQ